MYCIASTSTNPTPTNIIPYMFISGGTYHHHLTGRQMVAMQSIGALRWLYTSIQSYMQYASVSHTSDTVIQTYLPSRPCGILYVVHNLAICIAPTLSFLWRTTIETTGSRLSVGVFINVYTHTVLCCVAYKCRTSGSTAVEPSPRCLCSYTLPSPVIPCISWPPPLTQWGLVPQTSSSSTRHAALGTRHLTGTARRRRAAPR